MKRIPAIALSVMLLISLLSACAASRRPPENGPEPSAEVPRDGLPDEEIVPYDAELNLEVMQGKFRFQRIATTPRIVYSDRPITDMGDGTAYENRHDILTTLFRAADGKEAAAEMPDCAFTHYLYLYDGRNGDVPWHYRFAFCGCGAAVISNNDEFLCAIRLSEEELRSVLDALQ